MCTILYIYISMYMKKKETQTSADSWVPGQSTPSPSPISPPPKSTFPPPPSSNGAAFSESSPQLFLSLSLSLSLLLLLSINFGRCHANFWHIRSLLDVSKQGGEHWVRMDPQVGRQYLLRLIYTQLAHTRDSCNIFLSFELKEAQLSQIWTLKLLLPTFVSLFRLWTFYQ